EGQGLVLVGPIEPRAAPGGLGRLEDERGHGGVVPVGVDAPEAMPALLEQEGERRVRKCRPQPNELIGAPVDLGPEVLGVLAPPEAVPPVGPKDEMGVGVLAEVADLALELEPHPELRTAPLQDVEQELA